MYAERVPAEPLPNDPRSPTISHDFRIQLDPDPEIWLVWLVKKQADSIIDQRTKGSKPLQLDPCQSLVERALVTRGYTRAA